MGFGVGVVPTDEQTRIVAGAAALERGDSLKVIAYAGAAKTSTCVMIANSNPSRRYYYGAFNAKIAREASSRFPCNVTCSTVHALARRSLDVPTSRIDKRRLNGMVVADVSSAARLDRMTSKVRFLVARTLAAFVVSDDGQPDLEHLWAAAAGMSLTANEGKEIESRALGVAAAVWAHFGEWRTNKVLLPHDVYLKMFERDASLVVDAFAPYHTAFLDEAQDANPVMRSVFERSGCALVAVGDPMQSIYAFRGAENALDLLPGASFELSQSFRFGETIAAAAWAVLQCRPEGAPSIRLRGNGAGGKIVFDRPCRVTLCRSNAGVVRKALSVAGSGRNVYVIGGVDELVREVRSAVALHQGRPDDVVADSMRSFRTWAEFTAYASEAMDVGFERLISMVSNGEAANIGLLETRCVGDESLAAEVVGTAHKAKGLEWDEVALSDDFVDKASLLRRWNKVTAGGRRDESSKAVLEEFNLTYVAATRAKHLLSLPADLRGFLSGMEILRPIAPQLSHGSVRAVEAVADAEESDAAVEPPYGRAPMPRIGFVSRDGLAPHEVGRLMDSLKALGCLVVLSGDRFALSSGRQPHLVDHVLVVPSVLPHLGRDLREAAASARLCAAMGMGVASMAERFEIHAAEVASFPLFASSEPSPAWPPVRVREQVIQVPAAVQPVVASAPFVAPLAPMPIVPVRPAGLQGPANPFTGLSRVASSG